MEGLINISFGPCAVSVGVGVAIVRHESWAKFTSSFKPEG
jgi:hypothetical protein